MYLHLLVRGHPLARIIVLGSSHMDLRWFVPRSVSVLLVPRHSTGWRCCKAFAATAAIVADTECGIAPVDGRPSRDSGQAIRTIVCTQSAVARTVSMRGEAVGWCAAARFEIVLGWG